LGDGRIYGLLPLADGELEGRPDREPETLSTGRDRKLAEAHALADDLASAGSEVALSGPRRDPGALHDALREAELLLELGCTWPGQDQTYRLLVGILFRDPFELEQLRAQTISAIEAYDERHDTDLLATLNQFLRHHGSTTETADAMNLHRHTVGYRLARVHEVSGLSPYESDGRERLSLGLKGHRILMAHERLMKPG
jgi:DNA-binding PucR family transcriptional regulator